MPRRLPRARVNATCAQRMVTAPIIWRGHPPAPSAIRGASDSAPRCPMPSRGRRPCWNCYTERCRFGTRSGRNAAVQGGDPRATLFDTAADASAVLATAGARGAASSAAAVRFGAPSAAIFDTAVEPSDALTTAGARHAARAPRGARRGRRWGRETAPTASLLGHACLRAS